MKFDSTQAAKDWGVLQPQVEIIEKAAVAVLTTEGKIDATRQRERDHFNRLKHIVLPGAWVDIRQDRIEIDFRCRAHTIRKPEPAAETKPSVIFGGRKLNPEFLKTVSHLPIKEVKWIAERAWKIGEQLRNGQRDGMPWVNLRECAAAIGMGYLYWPHSINQNPSIDDVALFL